MAFEVESMTNSRPGPDELSLTSAPGSIPVSVQNVADEAAAERFAYIIGHTAREIGRYIDLERLDGITVAYDYDAALAQLDRGFAAARPLRRTSDSRVLGVAMAPAVLRAGVVKAHMLFFAPIVLPLEEPDTEEYRQALYIVAHECAHVEDLKHRDLCFPGALLQRQIHDAEEAFFEPIVDTLWQEYAACRGSATFGADQTASLAESFVSVLNEARARANASIRSYRLHGDVNRALEEAGEILCEPLRLAAYLSGHLDGLGEELDATPAAQASLGVSGYARFVYELRDVLRHLWWHRGAWTSRADFLPLREIIRAVLREGGLAVARAHDGSLYVNVPYTLETMPAA